MLTALFVFLFAETLLTASASGDFESTAVPFNKSSEVTDADAESYLLGYGYMEFTSIPRNRDQATKARALKEERLNAAIIAFQKFAKIPVTGKLDKETKRKMKMPRCGVKDTDSLKRSAKYTWKKKRLTWRIHNPTRRLEEGYQRAAVYQALDKWSKVVPLDFVEAAAGQISDLVIDFSVWSHGDGYSFDGPGGVLAHAFYPQDGRCHFDDTEYWYFEDPKKTKDGRFTELLTVATHELGHALGLPHSPHPEAIMAPFYNKKVTDTGEVKVELHQDDIYRIQRLYGARVPEAATTKKPRPRLKPTTEKPRPRTRRTTPTTAPTTKPPRRPPPTPPARPGPPPEGPTAKPCYGTLDAITSTSDGNTFLFSGPFVWKTRDGHLGNPMGLRELFHDGPGHVTMAVTKDGKHTLLFQDRKFWAFDYDQDTQHFMPVEGNPKTLPGDTPFTPAESFQWADGNLVFIKGEKFFTWDEHWNKLTFSGQIDDYFPGIPDDTNEAFYWRGELYFVFGDRVARYSRRARKVEPSEAIDHMFYC